MIAFFLALILFIFPSCQEPSYEEKKFTIMSWNVQTLLDINIDGDEFSNLNYEQYGREAYIRRIRKVCDIVDDIDADVVILEEVENSNVLKDMVDMYLSRKGYLYFGSIKEEGSSISIGFISKLKTENIQVHSVENNRSVLSLDFLYKSEIIKILACHGRSQISGYEQSEKDRISLSKTIRRVISENENQNLICIGDFNEDPLIDVPFQTALYNIEKDNAFYYRENGSLLLTDSKYNATKDILYSPQLDLLYNKSKKGTYVYNDKWFNLDLVLISSNFFDHNGVEFDFFDIYSP